MESRIKNILLLVNYIMLIIAMLASAFINLKASILIIFLYLIVLSSLTIRTYMIFSNTELEKPFDKSINSILLLIFTYILEISISIVILRFDTSLLSFIIPILVTENIVVHMPLKVSLPATTGIYVISCIMIYTRYFDNKSTILLGILVIIPVYTIVFILFYLINYLLKQNNIIEQTLKSVSIKNIEKDNLYRNLNEAYSRVESMAALRERNKIAAEIHDTVGHTLTTVLVELEASKRLMSKDTVRSLEKLNLAQGQVRKGLNDIRSSVRILEKGDDILDFYKSLEALIENTMNNSEVTIRKYIDNTIELSEILQGIVFSALMEGLSNGIRHGGSTEFTFELSYVGKALHFLLKDNGKGTSVILPGFGLRAMKTRVTEAGGTFDTISKAGSGFCIDIYFPLKCNEVGYGNCS